MTQHFTPPDDEQDELLRSIEVGDKVRFKGVTGERTGRIVKDHSRGYIVDAGLPFYHNVGPDAIIEVLSR